MSDMTDTADLVKRVRDLMGDPTEGYSTPLAMQRSYMAQYWEQYTPKLLAALEAAQAREKKLERERNEAYDRLGEEITELRNDVRAAEARAEAAEASLAAAKERVKELEGALKPFAAKADLYEANHPTSRHPLRDATQITHRLGDFRAARTSLKTAARKE